MAHYYHIEKGRSITTIVCGIFVLFLSTGFFFASNAIYLQHHSIWACILPLGIGLFLLVLFISCLYALIKGENWEISIKNNILSWSYPRWPKSEGTIELKNISKVTIRDDSFCNMKIEFNTGEVKKVKLVGNNYKLKKFFEENYKDIEIEFLEGSS